MKDAPHVPQPVRVCPSCGRRYDAHPAISRQDGVTAICPDCGIREALASLGCGPEEQEEILAIVHRFKREE